MYVTLLALHNIIRWLVLGSLIFGIYSSAEGLISKRAYVKRDKIIRGIASGVSHLQLLLGLLLYASVSPIAQSFLQNGANGNDQLRFFGWWHPIAMFVSVILVTIGAAKAKRASSDTKRFSLILVWFSIALVIILSAIPWFRPFYRAI